MFFANGPLVVQRHILVPELAEPRPIFRIELPSGAEVLDVQVQPRTKTAAIWFCVYRDNPIVTRLFHAYEDNEPIGPSEVYIGTFQASALVWHIFEFHA